MLNAIPFERKFVGQISEHHTKDRALINWKLMIKRKMNATAAMLPALLLVPT